MDISNVANWLGLITGIAFLLTSTYKIYRWFQAKVAATQAGVKFAEDFVSELLNNATNPARRADIHAFIQFHHVKIEGEKTSIFIEFLVAFSLIFLLVVMFNFTAKYTDIYAAPWFWIFILITSVVGFFAIVMAMFFNRQILAIHRGWSSKANDALLKRALTHIHNI